MQKYAGDKIVGLSTDTKPTNIKDGATFYESDTKKLFLKISNVWEEVNYADIANAMGSVNHGADANTARPTGYNSITWIGTVEPVNATNDDVWIDVS